MSDDQVGFNTAPRDQEIEEVKKILNLALEEPDVFNDWEQEFAKSALEQIEKYGPGWKYSLSRKEAVEKIKAKLEREGLI